MINVNLAPPQGPSLTRGLLLLPAILECNQTQLSQASPVVGRALKDGVYVARQHRRGTRLLSDMRNQVSYPGMQSHLQLKLGR